MSATSDDITIDLDEVDATEEAPKAKKVANSDDTTTVEVKPAKKERINPDEGIAKLQKDLAEARAAQEAAERRAQAASAAEVQARTEVQGTHLDLVKNAITQITAQNDTLEANYAAALSDQDFAAAAKIQRQMVENQTKLTELERKKGQLENAPKPAASVAPNEVENFVKDLSRDSADWVRKHPEYALDPAKTHKMVRAHEDAIDEGLKADTPEYFAFVEGRLKIGHTDAGAQDEALSGASQARSTRSAPPASAPVSRSGNGAGPRSNVVTLTPDEVEIAKLMDMKPEEYARHKIAIKREGMN